MPRKMKESGVEWLGQIPDGWGLGRVKNDFAHVKSIAGVGAGSYDRLALTMQGVIRRSKDDTVGLQPQEFESYQVLRPNELVFKLIDLQNVKTSRVGRSPFEGIVSPAYIVLHPRSEQNSKYAEYFFLALWMHEIFQTMGGDAVRSCLTAADLLNIQLPRPPCSEQERIAAFLDERCAKIDGMIAEAKASIEDYKKWKQSIIFEAVTGKHEKNLKPSGVDWIGDVPEGWKVCNASRVIHSTQNGLTRRDLVDSSGEIVLRLKNINPSGIVDYSSVVRMRLTEAERSRYALREGDLLFARVNGSRELVGKCAVFCTQSEIVAYNDHLIRVRLNDCMDVKYFTYYLTSSAGRTEIDKYVITAAGQCTISGEGLRLVKVVLPTYENQRRIAAELDEKCAAIDKLVGEKEALIADLEAYKKSLIFETVTGKREVA